MIARDFASVGIAATIISLEMTGSAEGPHPARVLSHS